MKIASVNFRNELAATTSFVVIVSEMHHACWTIRFAGELEEPKIYPGISSVEDLLKVSLHNLLGECSETFYFETLIQAFESADLELSKSIGGLMPNPQIPLEVTDSVEKLKASVEIVTHEITRSLNQLRENIAILDESLKSPIKLPERTEGSILASYKLSEFNYETYAIPQKNQGRNIASTKPKPTPSKKKILDLENDKSKSIADLELPLHLKQKLDGISLEELSEMSGTELKKRTSGIGGVRIVEIANALTKAGIKNRLTAKRKASQSSRSNVQLFLSDIRAGVRDEGVVIVFKKKYPFEGRSHGYIKTNVFSDKGIFFYFENCSEKLQFSLEKGEKPRVKFTYSARPRGKGSTKEYSGYEAWNAIEIDLL